MSDHARLRAALDRVPARPPYQNYQHVLTADLAALLAERDALAAVAEAPLDVERLAQAIRTAELRTQMHAESLGAVPAETGPMPDWYRAYAADVIAAYDESVKP